MTRMVPILSRRLLLFLALCYAGNPGLSAASDALNQCDVVRAAANYSRQTLRIRGILVSGAEQVVLYDPNCVRDLGDTYVSVLPRLKKSKKLDRLIKKDRRAWVIVEGTFYGPELAEIDPKLPQWMQDRLKGTMKRYGHLNSCSTMIEVSRIVSVEAVSHDTPWQ